mmetsp:Transcript_2694/g.6263  ORF Transcript_2694/g.6263 Transcript_2694/m.6263 type:complete len:82 (+) Transcript_2694:138-383(+)
MMRPLLCKILNQLQARRCDRLPRRSSERALVLKKQYVQPDFVCHCAGIRRLSDAKDVYKSVSHALAHSAITTTLTRAFYKG